MTYEDRLITKRFLVTGKRRYRNHDPGSVFEARLDPDAERRAIERGAIRLLSVVDMNVKQFEAPKDWPLDAVDVPTNGDATGVPRVKVKEGR